MTAFEKSASPARFGAGRPICFEGERADFVYRLTSGVARLFKSLPDGRRQVLGFAFPGDYIAHVATTDYDCSADAIRDVAAIRFSHRQFVDFVRERPSILAHLTALADRDLQAAQEHMLSLGRRNAAERLAVFLMDLMRRLNCVCDLSAALQIPIPGRDIADHLGLTTETVSRTFNRFARDGVLTLVPDGVRILDLATLQTLAQSGA